MRIARNLGGLAIAALTAFATAPAAAFCVDNRASAAVYAIALDGSGFEADIAPGTDACGQGKSAQTQVLAVTGYVPVAKNKRPGWQAECRINLGADDRALVRGDAKRITCTLAK